MASRQTETRDAIHREHAYIRKSLHRIDMLVNEEHQFLQHNERHLWKLERDRQDREIIALQMQNESLSNRIELLVRDRSLQGQHNQPRSAVSYPNLPVYEPPLVVPPAVHHTSFSGTLPMLNSGVPRFLAQPAARSSSDAGIYNLRPSLFGEYTPRSPEINFDIFGVPEFAQNTARATSPEYSPPSPTLMMDTFFADSRRSPKRPASAVDDGEAHFGTGRGVPRTNVAQGSISAPAPLQEALSPRIKRQRNISEGYFLVKSEPDEGELQRLTMYAGHTPNRSISSPPAVVVAATATAPAVAGPSGSGITSTAAPFLGTEVKPEIKSEIKSDIKTEIKAEIKVKVEPEIKTEVEPEIKTEVEPEIKTEIKTEIQDEVKAEVKAEETGTAEIDSFYENVMRNSPPLSQRNRRMTIPEVTEGFQSQIDEAIRRQSQLNVESYSPPTNPDSSITGSPASQRALLDALDDNPLAGPLMIRNIPAQDELFLEVLNGKLGSISQGQDALPKVMQGLDTTAILDDAERSQARSDSGEEADVVLVTREPESLPRQSGTEHVGEDEDAPVKVERPVRREDSDSDGESGPEIALKLRHTSNFGAPFGKM